MLHKAIYLICNHFLRGTYLYKFSILADIFSIVFSLAIYWYTSKTFESSIGNVLEEYKQNYFQYIVLGEILLAVPLTLFEGTFRNIKRACQDGTLETIINLRVPPIKIILLHVSAGLPREIIRTVVMLLIVLAVSGFNVEIKSASIVFFIQIFTIPIFASMGIIASSIHLLTARGTSVIGYANTLFSFFAGAFFPIEVFPLWIQKMGVALSPYSLLLTESRNVLKSVSLPSTTFFLGVGLWSSLIPLAMILFKYGIKNYGNKRNEHLY